MAAPQHTDWDSYYARPAATARFTRRFTVRKLTGLLAAHTAGQAPLRICELGGANSCVLDAILNRLPVAGYHVLDSNARGLSLLAAQHGGDARISWMRRDLLALDDPAPTFDVVFSIGLIEHFDPRETARVIRAHFALARPGGLVLMSFPTPTLLYRATRAMLEWGGQWAFPDERPLRFAEVIASVTPRGRLLHRSINWPVMLTQGFVVARVAADLR